METIKIPKQKIKGEDQYKTFSIRIPDDLYEKLTQLALKTEISRNEMITILLNSAVDIAVVDCSESYQEK